MIVSTCTEPKCDNPRHGRGLCRKHYARFRRANPDAMGKWKRLTPSQVRKVHELRAKGWNHNQLARKFDVAPSTISEAASGKRWPELHPDYIDPATYPAMPLDADGKPIPGFEAEGVAEIRKVLRRWAARHGYEQVTAQVVFHKSVRPIDEMAPSVILCIFEPEENR